MISLAPNAAKNRAYATSEFDNRAGTIRGNGNIRFRNFDTDNTILIDTTVQLQEHCMHMKGSLTDLYMALSNIHCDTRSNNAAIIAQQGDQLVAFCPACDGSIVPLESGDHDVFYDSSEPGGLLDVIRGYDSHNKLFEIVHGQRT